MNDSAGKWHGEHSIETEASPEVVWNLFRDVPGWTRWNTGIERVALEGPFVSGTWFTMKPPGQEELRCLLVEVREPERFVDETKVGDLTVTVVHQVQQGTEGRTRVTYSIDAHGPGSAEIGPAISADFPDVLATLSALAVKGA